MGALQRLAATRPHFHAVQPYTWCLYKSRTTKLWSLKWRSIEDCRRSSTLRLWRRRAGLVYGNHLIPSTFAAKPIRMERRGAIRESLILQATPPKRRFTVHHGASDAGRWRRQRPHHCQTRRGCSITSETWNSARWATWLLSAIWLIRSKSRVTNLHLSSFRSFCFFLFCYVTTQLARQLQQERSQVEVQEWGSPEAPGSKALPQWTLDLMAYARLSTQSWWAHFCSQTAYRPMTICWRYYNTSTFTSRWDSLKILGVPVTLDQIFAIPYLQEPSWVVHPARITSLHTRLTELTPVMVQALGKQKDVTVDSIIRTVDDRIVAKWIRRGVCPWPAGDKSSDPSCQNWTEQE